MCLLSAYYVLALCYLPGTQEWTREGMVTAPKELHSRDTWNESFMGSKPPFLVVHISIVWQCPWKARALSGTKKTSISIRGMSDCWRLTAHCFLHPAMGTPFGASRTNQGSLSCSFGAYHRGGAQQLFAHLICISYLTPHSTAGIAIPVKQLHSTVIIKTTGSYIYIK